MSDEGNHLDRILTVVHPESDEEGGLNCDQELLTEAVQGDLQLLQAVIEHDRVQRPWVVVRVEPLLES